MSGGSLRTRLIGGTVLWLALALLVGGLALSSAFRRSVESAFAERLASLQLAVIAALDVPPDAPARIARPVRFPDFDRIYSGWYWQVDDGDTRLASRSLWDAALPLDPAASGGSIVGPRQEPLRVVSRPLQYPSRSGPVTVSVAAPEDELRREIAAFDRLLVLALGVLALSLVAGAMLQVAYGLRPFRRLRAELDAVRAGRRARLGDRYPTEIAPLVETMNVVLDEDARRVERARALAGNLAHGLKTPLSVLGVEAARPAPDRERIAAQVSRMSGVIDHHLARAAAVGAQAIAARTPLAPVAAELRAMLQRVHAGRELEIEVAVADDLIFAGERQDLEEMLGNLIDNACKWAASRVTVRAVADRDRLRIDVEDDGPGLADDSHASARQRGVRLDPAEPGSGLGLAITTDLAQIYGGGLDLERSPAGGLHARLRLPRAPTL
jgi:signal transduction histidine kinase